MADEKVDDGIEEIKIIETDAQGKPLVEAEDQDEGDSRLADDASDQGDGKPSDQGARKRETHQERRERWRKARERDQKEMRFLRGYVNKLEGKVNQLEHATTLNRSESVDQRLADALNEVTTAERIMAAAIQANNGTDAVQAQRLRDEARDRARILEGERERLKAPPQAPSAPPPPAYLPLAQEFARDKPWFTWNAADADSRTILEIDKTVTQEGYDPNTREYWEELESRVQEKLPHRFKTPAAADDEDDEDRDEPPSRSAKKGPALGSRGGSRPPGGGSAYISPERKQAMMEAGVWDDPVLRRRYAKAYSEWDRNNTSARR